MVTSAFKVASDIVAVPPIWIPQQWTLANIRNVWEQLNFARYFANSLWLSVLPTGLVLLTSALSGYVLAKMDFRGRDLLFWGILATMMVPWPMTLIPRYQMMVWFGWVNSYWSMVIPFTHSVFGIFLVRQFMHSIPDELLDAARVDGASEIRIFVQIVLPLSKPVLSAFAIFEFLFKWNWFLWPFLILSDADRYTLPVALRTLQTEFGTDYAAMMAGASIAIIPVLIVFLVLQRQFVEGVTLTGIRG
jgi:ABC-type glycerol-3-phosphate transport system permease component